MTRFMPGRTTSLVATCGAACAGLSLWCSLGVLAITDAGPGASRVGLLPPFWLLAVLVAGGAAVAAVSRLRGAPAVPLFASLVLVVPWLPLAVPDAWLVWTGHLVWWVWGAIGVSMLAAARPRALPSGLVPCLADPLRGALTAGLLAAIVYASVAWKLAPLFPGGDEPHYLIITQSLLRDHDLQIENNHRRGDYHEYFKGTLNPDFLQRGRNGQIYSIHAPGLPALVSPAFAVSGYRGVELFLILLAGCATALVWHLGLTLGGTVGAAWFAWAAVALSAPFLFQAFAVYPEVAGSLMVMIGVTALVHLAERKEALPGGGAPPWLGGTAGALLQGGALAVLPWLHTRYALAAGVLGMILLLRLLAEPHGVKRALTFLVLPVASAIAWLAFFYVIYGTISPAAPYGRVSQARLSYIPVAFPALLFDQQFGLIPNAPVYFMGFLGLFGLLRWRRRIGVELLVVTFSYLLVAGSFRMWWGGQSAPGRFTVPVLPVLALGAACAWVAASRAGRVFLAASLFVTLLISATLVFGDGGWLIFNDRRNGGYALWLDWLTPLVDLPNALPSFIRGRPEPALGDVAVWLACLGVAWLAVRRIAARFTPARPVLATAGITAIVLAVVASLWGVGTVTATGGATAASSQLDLLARFDPRFRTVGVNYSPLSFTRPESVIRRLALSTSTRRPRAGGDQSLLSIGSLPAGLYLVEAEVQPPAAGSVRFQVGKDTPPVETCPVSALRPGGEVAGASGCLLHLPTAVQSLTAEGDDEARRTVTRLTLRPLALGATDSRRR